MSVIETASMGYGAEYAYCQTRLDEAVQGLLKARERGDSLSVHQWTLIKENMENRLKEIEEHDIQRMEIV